MGDFNREMVIELILNGVPPEAAVAAAGASDDLNLRWIVAPTGSLGDTPDPSCVAYHLRGIGEPTREDIERALDLCSG